MALLTVKLGLDELTAWKLQAKARGLTLSAWIRRLVLEAGDGAVAINEVLPGVRQSDLGLDLPRVPYVAAVSGAAIVDRGSHKPSPKTAAVAKGASTKTLCPRCTRIGRPLCANCMASKAPSIVQEASGDEQARKASASQNGAEDGRLEASGPPRVVENAQNVAQEIESTDLSVAQPVQEAGEGPFIADLARLPAKPTVNQSIGHKPGLFRPSPRCENSRCARLQMALCDPCRQVNKAGV